MNWLELVTVFLLNPIKFPLGFFRVWLFEEKRKKTFREIINEWDVGEICMHGSAMSLDIFAALFGLMIFLLIVAGIISIFKRGFSH